MADLGKILIIPRGTYSALETYNILDVVRYNGKIWCCKGNNVSGIAPTESEYWTLWVQDGSGGSGTGDMLKSQYDTDDDGIVDSAETLDGLTATIAQLNYLNTATGNIQSQIGDRIVDPVTKSNGQVLTYDSANNQWKAATPTSGVTSLAALDDTSVTNPATGQLLRYNGSGKWENQNFPAIPTITDTYSSTSHDGMSGYAVASAIGTKADASDLDEWVATTASVQSDNTVSFSNLNDAYSYKIFYTLPSGDSNYSYSKVTKTGSGTSTTLTFTTDAPQGTVCRLRIIKG